MKDLSIIVVSYNTKKLTSLCIKSVLSTLGKISLDWEVILVDNNSTDGSKQLMNELHNEKRVVYVQNKENEGFGKANNKGLYKARGRYILFLNSDVELTDSGYFPELLQYFDKHPGIGVVTVKVTLSNGHIDPACHRGFPTPWRSFCYFSKLEYICSRIPILNRYFGGYHLTHLPLDTAHEIDSPTGAFFLVRKTILDTLQGFDEDYFMYGEDIDLSFRIKKLGYAIIYNPTYSVTHHKGKSGYHAVNEMEQRKTRSFFWRSMLIFYQKHYEIVYPKIITKLIIVLLKRKIKQYETNRN